MILSAEYSPCQCCDQQVKSYHNEICVYATNFCARVSPLALYCSDINTDDTMRLTSQLRGVCMDGRRPLCKQTTVQSVSASQLADTYSIPD